MTSAVIAPSEFIFIISQGVALSIRVVVPSYKAENSRLLCGDMAVFLPPFEEWLRKFSLICL